ncbi:MAG: MFS transporter [Deltaproteobacteria bacterium]|jgi:MFS family permease|nr:MFS transporter [Deltaproteobacteria bacterium]
MLVYVWYPILASLATGFAFMNLAPFADDFMKLYDVGYGGLSFLLSALFWTHSQCQIPAGLIVDKFGAYRIMIVSSIGGIVTNIVPLLAPDSLSLAVSMRLILGICTGLNFLAVLKIIGSLAPPEKMAKSQGYQGAAFGLGTMLPYLQITFVDGISWRWTYIICGLIFLMVLLGSMMLPNQAKGQRDKPQSVPGSYNQELSSKSSIQKSSAVDSGVSFGGVLARLPSIIKTKELWALGILHGLSYGTLNSLGQWLPSIMSELNNAPISTWSTATIIILLIGTASRSGSGPILNLVSRRTAILGVIVGLVLLYTGLGLIRLPWLALSIGAVLAAISGLNYGSIFNLGSRIMPVTYMATSLGFMIMVANLTNIGMTLILGLTKEHTGSFQLGLMAIGFSALIGLIAFSRLITLIDLKIGQNTDNPKVSET